MTTLSHQKVLLAVIALTAASGALALPPNCHSYSPAGDCLVCSSGFYLERASKQCLQQNVPGCLKFVSNKNVCAVYADGAVASRRLQASCPSLQYPSGSGCAPITVKNCHSSSGTANTCAVCATSYYLFSPTSCKLSFKPNCLAYQTNLNLCATCNSPFVNVDGFCQASNDVNCQTFVLASNQCTLCQSLFFPVAGKCNSINKGNCVTSDGLVADCQVCAAGYFLTESKACAAQSLVGCTAFVDQTNYCTACIEGNVVIGGVCFPTKNVNCASFDAATNTCLTCNSLFFLSGGSCIPVTKQYCEASLGVLNNCSACALGYYPSTVSPGYCVRVVLPNCAQQVYNTNTCQNCEGVYQLVDGKCLHPNAVNCIFFPQGTTVCQRCASLFYIVDNGCQPVTLSNCEGSIGILDQCEVCVAGNYPDLNGVCQTQSISGCQAYVPNKNRCATCDSLKYPSQSTPECLPLTDTHCQSSDGTVDACGTCQPLFYLKADFGCFPSPVFCKVVDLVDPSKCSECSQGYTVNAQGACQPDNVFEKCVLAIGVRCVVCQIGYVDVGAGCVNPVANCVDYAQEETGFALCRKCATGFTLINGKNGDPTYNACLPPRYFVAGVHPSSLSVAPTQCSPLLYPGASNTCQALPSACAYGSGTSSACLVCKPGFYLSATACLAIASDLNCLTQKFNANACATCAPNARLNPLNFKCVVPSIAQCAEYDPIFARCQYCQSGFVPNTAGSSCLAATSTNCLSFSFFVISNKTCTKCKNTWGLKNGNCYPIPADCKTSDGVAFTCSVLCQPNEYKDPSTNLCVARNNANCATFEIFSNNCAVCQAGYFLTASKTCQSSSVPNCQVYETNENRCKVCTAASNLEAFYGICTFLPNCGYVVENNVAGSVEMKCKSCTKGFVMNAAGSCVALVAPLWLYVPATTSYCDLLFAATANNPAGADPSVHCAALGFNNCYYNEQNSASCKVCAAGSYTTGSACNAMAVDNCAAPVHNANLCLTCNTGYYLGPDGTCVAQNFRICATFVANTNVCATCLPDAPGASAVC